MTELAEPRPLTAALLLLLLAATATGCELSTDLSTAADISADVDTDSDSDSDIDPDDDPPDPGEDIDDADCDTENQAQFQLIHADSNSMAGATLARFLINRGQKVTGPIRAHEFLNYYRFEYAPPESGPVALGAQMRPTQEEGGYDLQIAARALDPAPTERRPLDVTLTIDTSASMAGTPIQRAKQVCVALANSLLTGDVVSMVDSSAPHNVMLQSHAVQGPGDPALIGKCNALTADGQDDLHAAIVKAYTLADFDFDPARLDRVVLISDGGAAVSAADVELIAEHAEDSAGEGIYLTAVGVGDDDSPDHYDASLMRAMTVAGKGAHVFIDSAEEATAVFGDRFVSTIDIAARDVVIDLTLPPTFDLALPDALYGSDGPGDPEPQHLSPSGAMIFQLAATSCDTTVPTADDQILVIATYRDPLTFETGSVELDTTLGELLEHNAAQLYKGSLVIAYARALEQLQTLDGQPALHVIDATLAQLALVGESLAGDPDLVEIAQLLTAYRELF